MPSAERHDALYVVGSLDETLELRGINIPLHSKVLDVRELALNEFC